MDDTNEEQSDVKENSFFDTPYFKNLKHQGFYVDLYDRDLFYTNLRYSLKEFECNEYFGCPIFVQCFRNISVVHCVVKEKYFMSCKRDKYIILTDLQKCVSLR
jgi:hypothetical protein